MLNKIEYQGRLTKDIELKRTSSDIAYCEFTIAWSEKYKEAATKCFLRCKAWRNTAEMLNNYFQKGKEILIEGHMITEEWEKDGQKQSRNICQIDRVHFCGKKEDGGSVTAPDEFANVPEGDTDLPFND
jgi:single-strand DNA-binding protein